MTEKGSTSCCEDYSGCSPSRYGGRLRGIEMVFAADCRAAVSAIVASPGAGSDYAAEYGFVHRRRRRILWLRHDCTSAMYQHMLGVAGLAAAADYLYFAMSLHLFGVAGSAAAISDYSYSSSWRRWLHHRRGLLLPRHG
jgi:hypothetical protein